MMSTEYTNNVAKLTKAIAEHAKANHAVTLPVVFIFEGVSMFMKSAGDIKTVERDGRPHRIEIQLYEDRRQ